MKRTKSIYLALLALVLSPMAANADVIDFEDIAVPAGSNDVGGDLVSGGFNFDSSSNHSHLVNDAFASHNGTTWVGWDDFSGNNVITMSLVGGGVFTLNSIDFSEFFDNASADLILVTGSGGQSVTIDLDNFADGAGLGNDFQTEIFNWTGLTSVTFDAVTLSQDNWWAFDNLVVNAATVPEPGTLALLGLGLVGIAARRRKTV